MKFSRLNFLKVTSTFFFRLPEGAKLAGNFWDCINTVPVIVQTWTSNHFQYYKILYVPKFSFKLFLTSLRGSIESKFLRNHNCRTSGSTGLVRCRLHPHLIGSGLRGLDPDYADWIRITRIGSGLRESDPDYANRIRITRIGSGLRGSSLFYLNYG